MLTDDQRALLKQRGLYGSYRKTLGERISQFKRSHRKEIDETTRRKRIGIEKDHRHRQVLCLCIFPFYSVHSPPRGLGYHFTRASPLYELGVKNMDFLIVNFKRKRPVAIFGEAKGSLENPSKVVTETMDRIAVVEDNEEHVRSSYLKTKMGTDVDFEYVLAAPVEKYTRICKAIEDEGGGLIPWSAGGLDERFLSLDIPPNTDKDIGKKMIHHDGDLNRSLKGLKSHDSCFSLFPQSHEVTWLGLMVESSEGLDVEALELKQRFQQYLFYLDDGEIDSIVTWVIGKAIEIGFIKKVNSEHYRIRSSLRRKERLEEHLRERWIEHSIEKEFEDNLTEIEADTTNEFMEEIGKQKTIL